MFIMRKRLSCAVALAAAVIIAGVAPAYSQQPNGDAGPKAAAAPKIFLPFTSFDFGSVHRGEIISQIFLIQNLGGADLIIKGLIPNCGCEVVGTDKVIAPGKVGKARIELNTAITFGAIHKTATLHTNDPERPTVELALTANVLANPNGTPLSNAVVRQGKHIGPVFLGPQDRLSLTVYKGERGAAEFTVTSERGGVKVLRVEGGEELLTSRVEALEEGKKYKVVLEPVSTEKPVGQDVQLQVVTDSPALPSFPVMVRFTVKERD
jgi:hypothetical protein